MHEIRPEAIITGHSNADFDALAAMVAASKLYPEATLVAPTMLDRPVRHDFTSHIAERFKFVSPKDCDLSGVRLLIVVDTHQGRRLEHVQEVLSNPDLEIYVYDHHPDSDDDLPANERNIRPWGSTTAILVNRIQEKGINLTPDEATMMGLGIYEDTGSFTFNSTTEHDLLAAAFLRASGMDLEIIGQHMNTDLTTEQVHVLNTMLRAAQVHVINGIPITITEVVLEEFMGDLASLVQKLMEMENLRVVFALCAMGAQVHLIARSRIPDLDVGKICAAFGGGGHDLAASASIKGRPLAEVKAELLTLLVSSVSPQVLVGKHMTSPAITVDSSITLKHAEDIMNRFGLKALPVLDSLSKACVGILDQQTAAKAGTHQLGNLPVSEYMHRNPRMLTPGSSLYEAMEIILKLRQRIIPVIQNSSVVGVMTRTDILRLLMDDTLHIPEGDPLILENKERNVTGLLKAQLPPEHFALLEKAGRLGDRLRLPVYAVGGFVRDLLLRNANLDVDLSVEGDGIAFAHALAEEMGGTVREHPRFRTASIAYQDGEGVRRHLDVATARLEYYERPGALPSIEPSSIKMDLFRRDFTMNALAVQLNQDRFGLLLDPFGGQRDMKDRAVSVMHSLSFIEDPTRIFRAARFELRFLFRISPQSERLIKNAIQLNMVDNLSGPRVFNELKKIFQEKEATACIRRMEHWDLLSHIHPMLKLNPAKDILISNIEEVLSWYGLLYKNTRPKNWIIYLLALCTKAKYADTAKLLSRLGFTDKARSGFLSAREAARKASSAMIKLHKDKTQLRPSVIYETLKDVEVEGLLYLMALHGQETDICRDISYYLTTLKDVGLDIDGEDLISLGENPGPQFVEILKCVLHEKLDQGISTREEQLLAASRCILALNGSKGKAREVLQGRT